MTQTDAVFKTASVWKPVKDIRRHMLKPPPKVGGVLRAVLGAGTSTH